MRLDVRCCCRPGEGFFVYAQHSATVSAVKDKIHDEKGLEPNSYTLYLDDDALELEKRLDEYLRASVQVAIVHMVPDKMDVRLYETYDEDAAEQGKASVTEVPYLLHHWPSATTKNPNNFKHKYDIALGPGGLLIAEAAPCRGVVCVAGRTAAYTLPTTKAVSAFDMSEMKRALNGNDYEPLQDLPEHHTVSVWTTAQSALVVRLTFSKLQLKTSMRVSEETGELCAYCLRRVEVWTKRAG